MVKKVIEASEAIAIAAKLCRAEVVPIYPITPQTHIPEKIAEMVNNGDMDAKIINVESEHSALSAAIGSEAVGSRTFTATSSQGLALMHEVLFIASGLRLPIVMAVANRALSAPLNIWNDHQDSISQRDSGWVQLYVESAQEAFDTTIMAYKIAEDKKILTPVMICLDGFTLTHVFEPVEIHSQKLVDKFLPKFSPLNILDPKKPITIGPIVFPTHYIYIKKQQQDAIKDSISAIKTVHQEFSKLTKNSYGNGLIEEFKTKDAAYIIVAMGTVCSTIRFVVSELRKKGKKVGLLRIKTLRPFPEENVFNALKKSKAVAVIDRDVSLGFDGALYTDLRSALYNKVDAKIHSFIAGLGGKDITADDICSIFSKIEKEKKELREWVL